MLDNHTVTNRTHTDAIKRIAGGRYSAEGGDICFLSPINIESIFNFIEISVEEGGRARRFVAGWLNGRTRVFLPGNQFPRCNG